MAAIAIGVAIAVFFLGGDKTKTVAETASAPAPSTGAKKKKKKNKKKSKADIAAPAPAVVEEKPKAPEPTPKVEEPAPVVEEKKAPVAPPANGGKKKKNKKKQNGAATNGAAKPAPAPAPAPAPPKETKPAPKPMPAIVPLQPRIVVEEEWATIPKKSKKKKKPVVAAAAPAPAEAAKPEAPKASVTVSIDASRVGIIIGPKGATMNAIQEKTGTKLDVNAPKPDENGGNQFRPVVGGKSKAKATIVITDGTSEGMKAAKKAILELADRGYAALLQAEGFSENSVSVHPRFLSEIVGTGGKIIKAIQSELDVKLTIPKTDWTPKTMQV